MAMTKDTSSDPVSATLTLPDLQSRIAQRQEQALARYRNHVNKNLAGQHRVQLFQRCLLLTVEEIYADTLRDMDQLARDKLPPNVVEGRASRTPLVLAAFQGFSARLLQQALQFNAGSCALSNFPSEQQPAADYLDDVLRDLAAAWRDFALEVNLRLLPKADFPPPGQTRDAHACASLP